jgi:hypothetical protein
MHKTVRIATRAFGRDYKDTSDHKMIWLYVIYINLKIFSEYFGLASFELCFFFSFGGGGRGIEVRDSDTYPTHYNLDALFTVP